MSEKNDWLTTAIYKKSGSYAREHGELPILRASNKANIACRFAIEDAIAKQWDGARLKEDSALPIIDQFGAERVQFVLATTLQIRQHDGRFSEENMAWAFRVQIEEPPQDIPSDRYYDWEVQSHAVKLNEFVGQAKAEIEQIAIREMPVYYESFQYAMDNNETQPYWDSIRCNTACARDIKNAISDHYDGYRLTDGAAAPVIKKYGQERTFFVIANTIQEMRDDGRVSRDNIQWADTIPIPNSTIEDRENKKRYMVHEHPGLFDLFTKFARREQGEKARLPFAEKLKQAKAAISHADPLATPVKKKEQVL